MDPPTKIIVKNMSLVWKAKGEVLL